MNVALHITLAISMMSPVSMGLHGSTSAGQSVATATRTRLTQTKSSQKRPVTSEREEKPEFLSGEATVTVAADANPVVRIGMAPNGITLIEFPASDKFFSLHAGNPDLTVIEKSPSMKRDHHLVLRAGKDFLPPNPSERGAPPVPCNAIVAQMDSGIAITFLIYPVASLKQQAHLVIVSYKTEDVVSARSKIDRATGLSASDSQSETATQITTAKLPPAPEQKPATPKIDYRRLAEEGLAAALKNPKAFGKFANERHGLEIATQPACELNNNARLVVFAVRNSRKAPLRLLAGYPDLFVETLSEKGRPVETGTRVERLGLAATVKDDSIAAGSTQYFAIAFQAPVMGVRQRLKIAVAHTTAADQPATAELTALTK